jgi:hypothetical protein
MFEWKGRALVVTRRTSGLMTIQESGERCREQAAERQCSRELAPVVWLLDVCTVSVLRLFGLLPGVGRHVTGEDYKDTSPGRCRGGDCNGSGCTYCAAAPVTRRDLPRERESVPLHAAVNGPQDLKARRDLFHREDTVRNSREAAHLLTIERWVGGPQA